jgi:hypothetical protein
MTEDEIAQLKELIEETVPPEVFFKWVEFVKNLPEEEKIKLKKAIETGYFEMLDYLKNYEV